MLAVKQVTERWSLKRDSIICPVCKKGRLCDKPISEKVKVVPGREKLLPEPSDQIILKCPKCGAITAVYISSGKTK